MARTEAPETKLYELRLGHAGQQPRMMVMMTAVGAYLFCLSPAPPDSRWSLSVPLPAHAPVLPPLAHAWGRGYPELCPADALAVGAPRRMSGEGWDPNHIHSRGAGLLLLGRGIGRPPLPAKPALPNGCLKLSRSFFFILTPVAPDTKSMHLGSGEGRVRELQQRSNGSLRPKISPLSVPARVGWAPVRA